MQPGSLSSQVSHVYQFIYHKHKSSSNKLLKNWFIKNKMKLKITKCCRPVSVPSHVFLEPMPLTLATVRCHLRVYRFSIGKATGKALCRVIFSSDFVSLWLLVSDLNKRDGTMFSGFFAFSPCHLISEMIRADHISGSQLTHFSLWWATPINQNQNQP